MKKRNQKRVYEIHYQIVKGVADLVKIALLVLLWFLLSSCEKPLIEPTDKICTCIIQYDYSEFKRSYTVEQSYEANLPKSKPMDIRVGYLCNILSDSLKIRGHVVKRLYEVECNK